MKSALHPTRPIVAYTSGCMITVYDLLTDQKFNLIRHDNEVQEVAFAPPGFGDDYLVSIDFNRNQLGDQSLYGYSKMCIWNWQKAQCIEEVIVPKSQNLSNMLLQPSLTDSSQQRPRIFQISFDKVGSTFIVLESSSSDMNGGGYRVTLWNMSRQRNIEMIS